MDPAGHTMSDHHSSLNITCIDCIGQKSIAFSQETTRPIQFDHPLIASPVLFILRCLAIALGLPIHLLVAVVILRTRQLYNPRNAFWLGSIACHCASLIMGAYEYWAVVALTRPTGWVCRIYSLLVGYPYTILLVSLLLATADRWFAISSPIKHRRYVTVSAVAVCLVTAWILVFFFITSPYWLGKIKLLACSVNADIIKWVTLTHFIIIIFIIMAQVAVFVRTRHCLRFKAHHPSMKQPPVDFLYSSITSSTSTTLKREEYFVHLPNKTICRLELEASVTLFCGVATLCVCALPLALVFVTLIVCKIGIDRLQCNEATIVALIPYARELLLLHSVGSPVLYILRSREFSKAFRRTLPRCFFFLRDQRRRERCASPMELRQF
ncbi:adenosine receptor A2b-like [Daphnia carinata]|uniref:adenosine receptor A2b-like n=1 Tax=Daphnia carinata TaxID=120202 RepID=UPI0028690956|nr:adenosine receptor A2b-like [Daphnia carinata]